MLFFKNPNPKPDPKPRNQHKKPETITLNRKYKQTLNPEGKRRRIHTSSIGSSMTGSSAAISVFSLRKRPSSSSLILQEPFWLSNNGSLSLSKLFNFLKPASFLSLGKKRVIYMPRWNHIGSSTCAKSNGKDKLLTEGTILTDGAKAKGPNRWF